jgi:ligand of Numb protein X 3/4
MSFALERFAQAVDRALQCKLCGQVLEEPLCTPCGHVFCASCLLPWAARRRHCPLGCQQLVPGELYRVLPLRSLLRELRIQCDYRARGCGHTVPLRELEAHVEGCAFGPASRGHNRWGCALGQGCSGGGGDRPQLGRSGPETQGTCAGTPGPRTGSGGGGLGPRPELLAFTRRERTLRAQLWALQGEAQLAARRYREKFAQYMAHIRNFARDLGGNRRVSAGRAGERHWGWEDGVFLVLEDSSGRWHPSVPRDGKHPTALISAMVIL